MNLQLPAGAVSMFGAAGNPMVAALKKPKLDSDSEVSFFFLFS